MENPEKEIANVVVLLTASANPEIQKQAVEECVFLSLILPVISNSLTACAQILRP